MTRTDARDPALARALGRSTAISRHFYRVRSERIPAGYRSLRIAHLTDVHVGRMTPEARLAGAIDAINALAPDVVCMTGDYVAHSLQYLPRLTHHLRRLTAPAFATLGNHDHWHGAPAVARALEHAGVTVLVNESVRFECGGSAWRLVGIDDAVTGHHDLERAFSDLRGEPIVVLSHLAELSSVADRRGAALVLSGHTHGGQIPNGGVVERVMRRMGHRYILGWYKVGDTPVYVNRGIGAAVFPWRTQSAWAEVAGVELGPARPDAAGPSLGEGIEELRSVTAWPGPPRASDHEIA